jgi:hypothetical protein
MLFEEFTDPIMPKGFVKFTPRALKHSKETDQEQSAQIAELAEEIAQVKQAITRLHQK